MVMTFNRPLYTASSAPSASPSQAMPIQVNTYRAGSTISLLTLIIPRGTPIPDGFELARSLLVEIEITADGFVIRSGEVDEEGYGSTDKEAYIDFVTSLRDRYHSLSRREKKLSRHDRAILNRLHDLLTSGKPAQT